MAVYHVFVDGATDGAPGGVSRLADTIAKHYGLPAADLLDRLQKGPLRVKANVDQATAEQYRRDLERLGARVRVEASLSASQRITPSPFPATRPGTPPPIAKPQFQSGLAAAFSSESPAASLGALEKDGALSLASVDGGYEPAAVAAPASFAPPNPASPASTSAAAAKAKPKSEKPQDVPVDLFAPPDAQGEELKVDLAVDEVDPRKRASTPPPVAETRPPSQPLPRASSPAIAKPAEPARRPSQPAIQTTARATAAARFGPLGEPRTRLVVGVLLAIVLGFVPAHLVARVKEKAAFAAIDSAVRAAQQQADTQEAYATLDRMRADQRARKEGERRNAAIIAFAIWALVGGGIAFVWFRKVPWE